MLVYPTAPSRLRASDVPGYQGAPAADGDGGEEEEISDSWAWWRKDEHSGSYRFLSEGMSRVAESIESAVAPSTSSPDGAAGSEEPEPLAGVIGFSQGGCMAAMLASALEARPAPPGGDGNEQQWGWVDALRRANRGRPLKFAVVYSGFYAPPPELGWLYEPKIATPTLHFVGSLDTVVDEGRSQGLVDRCEGAIVVVHPGGHHVPVSKEWVMPLVGFIRQAVGEEKGRL